MFQQTLSIITVRQQYQATDNGSLQVFELLYSILQHYLPFIDNII